MVEHPSGHVFIEAIIAMAVLGILASFAFTGDRGQLRHVAQSLAETKAQRLAASRIEVLKAIPGSIASGRRAFALASRHVDGLPQAEGVERIRVVEPGLLEVDVTVGWLPAGARTRREVHLTTWLARGVR